METNLTLDEIAEINPEAMLADGFSEAILGMCLQFGCEPVVAYDYNKCVGILVNRDGMTNSEAIDYIQFNVLGAYVGNNTPVFIMT
jgi:hypothetical protein|tara:strand:+ start:974 stop:1231 length:258 start_codon:yes stop_codon:yes gene_type:complete